MVKSIEEAVDLAVGAVAWEGEGFSLILISQGELYVTYNKRQRYAEKALLNTIERIWEDAEDIEVRRHITETPHGWSIALVCPDGEPRIFRAKRPKEGKPARVGLKPEARFEVLKRDGFACHYCGRRAPDVALHVDHVLAVSAGGTDDMDNLVAACFDCNIGKLDRSL